MLTKTEYDLQHTSPEQQGVASSAILKFVQAIERQISEIHSFMLLRHGSVIAEGWWSPYGREHPHMLFSLSKSFTSTAVGLAVSEGYFSVDDPVLSFFPDETPAEVNEFLKAMCVRHLLSMSTGHAVDTMPLMFDQSEMNWVKGFLEVPVTHAPGTHFLYNTGATYMLSAIVQKTTGKKLVDYLEPRLFEPLGIENAIWQESPQGINTGGFGLTIKTEHIARFGQLYLQKGMWQGKRLLSEAWIEEATTSHISNGNDPNNDWNQGYGYQFWRCRHNAYRGDGAFGQYCIVMPEQDAVLAITGGLGDMQAPMNLVWDILLPAMTNEALPEDSESHDALSEKLSSLAFVPAQGQPDSPIASQVSGRIYMVDANELEIEAITLNFAESGCTLTVKTATKEESIICGYDQWQAGQTTLFNDPWDGEPKVIVASGAWTADNTYTMIVRLYETPFLHTVVYRFDGDEMRFETWVNVSFEPIKRLELMAHLA